MNRKGLIFFLLWSMIDNVLPAYYEYRACLCLVLDGFWQAVIYYGKDSRNIFIENTGLIPITVRPRPSVPAPRFLYEDADDGSGGGGGGRSNLTAAAPLFPPFVPPIPSSSSLLGGTHVGGGGFGSEILNFTAAGPPAAAQPLAAQSMGTTLGHSDKMALPAAGHQIVFSDPTG